MDKTTLYAPLLVIALFMAGPAQTGSGFPERSVDSLVVGQDQGQGPDSASIPADAHFAVAAIKEYDPLDRKFIVTNRGFANSGEFYVKGWTLRMLVERAFGIQMAQVLGGPNWIDSLRFEVNAAADESLKEELRKLSLQQAVPVQQHMIQLLLEDRFQLRTHKETKELPGFALVVAKNGPRLGEPIDQCGRSVNTGSFGNNPRPVTPPEHQPGESIIFAGCMALSQLATVVSRDVGRPVVDNTGLPGKYHFTLHFMPAPSGAGDSGGSNAPGGADQSGNVLPDSASRGPSIFVALQEQLGLKLEAKKVTVEVLVIDHVEHPSEN